MKKKNPKTCDKNVLMSEHNPNQSTSKTTHGHTNFVNGKWDLDLLGGEKAFA